MSTGAGTPLLFLHGGWGYEIYPFDRQIAALAETHRIVIPDRTGYGGSGVLRTQHADFHQRAAEETLALLDALGIDRPFLWGHSDGAVIALRLATTAPQRVRGVIAEATHFWRRKPRSRAFFETMRDAPEQLGERVVTTLQREHGDRWRALISTNGSAWLRIADDAASDTDDLYESRLGVVKVPVLLIHGATDPRTERGEYDALVRALGPAIRDACVLPEGGHSPHSERVDCSRCHRSGAPLYVRNERRARHGACDARQIVSALEFDGVSRSFATPDGAMYRVIDDVSLSIPPGFFVALVGPSGCGKSTLLNLAAGLLAPTAGVVRSEGTALDGLNKRATYMFQQDALLPWKTVRDNAALGLLLAGTVRAEANRIADEWLERVGLSAFASHFPAQLSGGMRKRLAMAQNWIINRPIVLMDEPFSALDVHTRQFMETELLTLWEREGRVKKTVLFVTHDLEEAIALADEVVVLSSGPGSQIVARHPVPLERPRDLMELRTSPVFIDLYRSLWAVLRQEVLRSQRRA